MNEFTLIRRTILVLLYVLFPYSSASQEWFNLFSAEVHDNYFIRNYTIEDGLPQMIVDDLVVDENNFLLVFTPTGVTRFDGQNFENLITGKSPFGIQQSFFNKKDLLINLSREGVVKYSNSRITKLSDFESKNLTTIHDRIIYRPVEQILKQADSLKSIGYFLEHDGLYQRYLSMDSMTYRIGHKIPYFENGIFRNFVGLKIVKRKLGASRLRTRDSFIYGSDLYIAEKDLTIAQLRNGSVIKEHDFLQNLIHGNYKQGNVNWFFLDHAFNDHCFLVVNQDVYEINIVNDEVHLQKLFNISVPDISCISRDKDRNIFIGSYSEGLFHLRPKLFEHSYIESSPYSQSYRAHIKVASDHYVTDSGYKIIEDNISDYDCFQEVSAFVPFGSDFIAAGIDGVFKIDSSLNCEEILIDSLDAESDVRMMCQDLNDNIWLVLEKRKKKQSIFSLGILNKTGIYTEVLDSLPGKFISIYCTPENMLHMNFKQKMLMIDPKKRMLVNQKTHQELSIRDSYFVNSDTAIYATYGNGLWWGDKHSFKPLNLKLESLRHSSCLIGDSGGYIWVATNQGLFKFFDEDILYKIRNPESYVYHQYFDRTFGLSTDEFNGAAEPCGSYDDIRKELRLNTVKGINFVSTEHLMISDSLNSKILVHLIADDTIVVRDSGARLSSSTDHIRMEISSPNYFGKRNIFLEYRLIGRDDAWKQFQPDEEIYFTSLYPRDYIFECRRLIGDNGASTSTSFTFTIGKRWYQKNFIKALFVVTLLFLIYFLFKWRIRYLENKNLELEEIIKSRTADLKYLNGQMSKNLIKVKLSETNLTSLVQAKNRILAIISHEIIGNIRMIKFTSETSLEPLILNDKREIKESIKDIYHSASSTENLLKQILEWSKSDFNQLSGTIKEVNLRAICENVRAQFTYLIKENKLKFENVIDASSLMVGYEISITLILHSLLENEFKHSYNAIITIENKIVTDYDVITINNNNSKILTKLDEINKFFNGEENSIAIGNSKGFGLFIIKDLLIKSESKITYQRRYANGHTVILRFARLKKPMSRT